MLYSVCQSFRPALEREYETEWGTDRTSLGLDYSDHF